jgi:hypothetical protein
MGTMVPIELIRLRSATTTYLEILRDSLPLVEALTHRDELPMAPLAELHEAIQSAVDPQDAAGTPAAIRTALAVLLGETDPPDRPPRARSARGSVLPHRGASPPLDDGTAETEGDELLWLAEQRRHRGRNGVSGVTSSRWMGAANETIGRREARP